jgi:Ribbon-helix-helix protein, copG family
MVGTEIPEIVKRESTSINIDPELWREVRHAAIDMGISATDFFEQALKEKLAKGKSKK